MNRSSTLLRKLILPVHAAAVWMIVQGIAQAAEEAGGSGGGGAQSYVLSYFLLILCIGLGLLFVCRSARRRDKPRGEAYEISAAAEHKTSGDGVPIVSIGMRVDQVNKLLGKPTICRRGDDIYRELAQAGKLPEEEAAKEYSVYDHPAGRYELVSLDKRIIEIKKQPKREASE
ncbi:hypothetical protein ACFL5Q_05715 [Planctomycetota bacterium]